MSAFSQPLYRLCTSQGGREGKGERGKGGKGERGKGGVSESVGVRVG